MEHPANMYIQSSIKESQEDLCWIPLKVETNVYLEKILAKTLTANLKVLNIDYFLVNQLNASNGSTRNYD